MRPNPEWRRRDRHIHEAYCVIDNLKLLKTKRREPLWYYRHLDDLMNDIHSLIHPLTRYRDQVPSEIED